VSYQQRDFEVVDYELFKVAGIGLVRGPQPPDLGRGRYLACAGAAQTFGCYCARPFPALVAEATGLPALNLGFAGAGPRLFLRNEQAMALINGARFAVVQVMSGRSEDNSLFRSGGSANLAARGAGADGDQPAVRAEQAWGELLQREDEDVVRGLVEETRANYVETFVRLLEAIAVPTVLLWFSKRTPEYDESYSDVYSLFGEFPHLVNRPMVEQLAAHADEYVECVTSRGSPQPLVSRFTGEPVTVADQAWSVADSALQTIQQAENSYYPSPEMHEDAAAALLEPARRLAERAG
jgi:hypothetical protein